MITNGTHKGPSVCVVCKSTSMGFVSCVSKRRSASDEKRDVGGKMRRIEDEEKGKEYRGEHDTFYDPSKMFHHTHHI
jgi:hypothetical protein